MDCSVRPNMVETTALGAAILAGVGAGVIDVTDVDESQVTKFMPTIGEDGKERFLNITERDIMVPHDFMLQKET